MRVSWQDNTLLYENWLHENAIIGVDVHNISQINTIV